MGNLYILNERINGHFQKAIDKIPGERERTTENTTSMKIANFQTRDFILKITKCSRLKRRVTKLFQLAWDFPDLSTESLKSWEMLQSPDTWNGRSPTLASVLTWQLTYRLSRAARF